MIQGDRQQGHRQDQNHDPDGRQRPVARVFRDVKRTDSGCEHQENLTDDLRQDDLDMGVHVSDDDLVLAEELLGKCHGSIMPDNDPTRAYGLDRSGGVSHDVGVDDADWRP